MLLERAEINEEQYKTLQEKAKKEQATRFQAGVEKGRLFLRSADGNFEFFLVGRLHTDFHATEGDARTLMGGDLNDRFLVRRARFGVEGKFFKLVRFHVEADFTETPTLKDSYFDLEFLPELKLRGGQFKEPFSLEELTSSSAHWSMNWSPPGISG